MLKKSNSGITLTTIPVNTGGELAGTCEEAAKSQ
jgi:hypothetical protein